MLSGMKQARLEVPGAYWMDGSDFHFTALGTSEEFACDYTMELLIPQVPNKNITYRHRHTLQHEDKIIPLFGTGVKAERIEVEGKKYLRTEFKVPTKTPRGEDLDANIVFMDWIKAKYEAKKPAGISYHWQYELNKDKKLKYAVLLEIAGTPAPACNKCLVGPPDSGEKKMDEKEKLELSKKTPDELQALLEQMTLELETKKKELEAKKGDLESIIKDRDGLKASLDKEKLEADTTSQLVKKLSTDYTSLKLEFDEMKKENSYLVSPKRKLVDELVMLEGDAELSDFYKSKDEAYLKKRLEKIRPKPDIAGIDPARKMMEAKKKLENGEGDPKFDEIIKNLAPNLREHFKKITDKEGGN